MYTITKYFTPSCASCKTMTEILHFNKPDNVEIKEINCEEVPTAFLSATKIYGVPTITLSSSKGEIARFSGPKTKSEYNEWLEQAMSKGDINNETSKTTESH